MSLCKQLKMSWTVSPSAWQLFTSGIVLSMIVPALPLQPFFIRLFPCLPDDDVQLVSVSDVQGCDLFTYAASVMALERVEERTNVTMEMFSVISETGTDSDANEVCYGLLPFRPPFRLT